MTPPSRARGPQALDHLALLYELVDQVHGARTVERVYAEAAKGLRATLGAERSALLLRDEAGVLRLTAWSGLRSACREALDGHDPWSGAEPARPISVRLEERGGEEVAALSRAGIRWCAWVPMLHRGRLMGALVLCGRSDDLLEQGELRLAEAIAGHVALAISRMRSDDQQEELLRRFEAERSVLESVVNHMPAGVLLAEAPGGRIITSNPRATSIWRKTLRHAERVSDYGMFGGRTADGQPLAPEAWPLARSVLTGETVVGEEIRIERGDGTRGVVRMSSSPVLDSRGEQLAAVATVFDVTEEREEESRQAFLDRAGRVLNRSIELGDTLDALARAAVAGFADWCVLYRLGPDGEIERVAFRHADQSRSEAVRRFDTGPIQADGEHPVARVIREATPLFLADLSEADVAAAYPEAADLDGVIRELEPRSVLVVPLISRDRSLGAISLVRSSSPFREADVELASKLARRAALAIDNALLYEQARAADRAKATFLAVMSHEFRTPLSAILGYADILTAQVHGELNEKQQTHLSRVKASVQHLSHLVDEVLSFASMEAGRERVVIRRVDLTALVSEAAGIMEPIAEAAGLALDVDFPADPLLLETDGPKVRQIVINLLSNAVKYTPEGSVSLRLCRDEDRAVCVVEDTGPGIDDRYRERVFEPFWQVNQSDDRVITGTGLGLAVARGLARLLDGDVTLDSRLGKGSRFTLSLPLQRGGVASGEAP